MGGSPRSGRRPDFSPRALERVRSATSRPSRLPTDSREPIVPNFQRSRSNFDIDIEEAFRNPGNGLQQSVVLSRNIILEEDYHRWLVQVGKVGDPGTSRAEHMIFRAFERRGWRFPESRPPGLDLEYLARVSGNEGGIEIDFFIRSREIAIRCQGEYWHYKDDPTTEASDVADDHSGHN